MTDTDKCPKCGKPMVLSHYGNVVALICSDCPGDENQDRRMAVDDAYAAALHRIRELEARIARMKKDVEFARQQLPFMHHTGKIEDCPTFYDGCNCTVENLAGLLDQAHADSAKIRELEFAARNARELHRAIAEMARRADPARDEADTDGLGQDVAAVVMLVHSLDRSLERQVELKNSLLARINELASVLEDIDTISRGPRTVAEQHEEIVELAREAIADLKGVKE